MVFLTPSLGNAAPAPAASELTCHRGQLESQYVGILQKMVEGGTKAAVGELSRLYECAEKAGIEPTFVARSFFPIARRIVKQGGESCLSAVVLLHQDAYISSFYSISSSVSGVVLGYHDQLVELLLNPPVADEMKSRVARLVGCLAIKERDAKRLSGARSDLIRALDLDPSNLALVQALSTLEEKQGYLSAAEERFRDWLRLEPQAEEPRLRLALTLKRQGKDEGAREELEGLLASSSESWVRAVAFQELVKWLIAEGEADRAFSLLLQAHREFPLDGALRIQLMQLRPTGRGLPEELVASFLEPLADHTLLAPSRRLIYNDWPADKMEPFLAEVESDFVESLACLKAELSGPAY